VDDNEKWTCGATRYEILEELKGLRADLRGWLHEAHRRDGFGKPVEVKVELNGDLFDSLIKALAKAQAEADAKDKSE
jgi:hypothetical protein